MNKDVHDIDALFRDEIESYKEMPRPETWDALEAKLDKEDASIYKRKFAASRRLTLALLLLLLGFVVYEKELVGKTYRYIAGTGSPSLNNRAIEKNKQDATNGKALPRNEIISTPARLPEERINDGGKVSIPDTYLSSENKERKNKLPGTAIRKAGPPSISAVEEAALVRNNSKDRYGGSKTSFTQPATSPVDFHAKSPGKSARIQRPQGMITAAGKYEQPFLNSPGSIGFPLYSIGILPVMDNRFYDIEKLSRSVKLILPDIAGYKSAERDYVVKISHPVFKPRWELTVIGSPQLSGSDLDNDADDHNGVQDDEKTEIKNREKYRFSYAAGMLLSWQFNRKWALQSGLLYSNTHISIDPQDIYAAPDNGSVAYKYNSSSGYAYVKTKSGLPQAVGDSILAKNAQQHISYLGLPVLLKYTIASRKISITPGLGISVNLLTRATLQTDLEKGLNTEQVMISKLKGTRTFFLGAFFNTEIKYHFSGRWSLNVMPSFSYSLTSITKDNVVNTYPYSLGIGAGITYAF